MKGDQKFEFGKSEMDEVFGSTQIDNMDTFMEKNLDSMDFTKKIVSSASRNRMNKRFLSPQPCMNNVLKSLDFQEREVRFNPYKEKSPEKQMIFQKMVKVPIVNFENLPKQASNTKESSRYEAFRDSDTSQKECSPFAAAAPKSDRQKSVRMH